MKILVVAHYINKNEPLPIFIQEQLKALCRIGNQITVIVPTAIGKLGPDGKRFSLKPVRRSADGIDYIYVRYLTLSRFGEGGFNSRSAISAIKNQIGNILAGLEPDIIHAHTLGFDSRIGAFLKKRCSCPLVVTTHGSDTSIPLENGHSALLCKDCNDADLIVAVSSVLADKVRSCKTSTKVVTVHNGFISHSVSDYPRRDPERIIQVGNLIPSKRVDVTIRALALLREKHPNMTLTVVGSGPELDRLQALAASLDVSDAVSFIGQVDNRRVFEEMLCSSFFVMVSKPEGFGIVYLEAMAAGCITLGTEGEGISDVMKNGENGFLLPADDPGAIADTIDACIKHPHLYDKISANAINTTKKLSWENNARAYTDLFLQL